MAHNIQDSDLSLVLASQNGNRDAFEKLVIKYQNRIFNALLRMIGDYETALDLCQDTFLKAYQNLGGFQRKSTFFTWLFRISINVATTKKRQYSTRPRSYSLSQYDSEKSLEMNEFRAKESSPRQSLQEQEDRDILYQEISSLPHEFRTALVLRDIEGLSYEEIQNILECPIGTVRSRLHRARLILKDRLANTHLVES